MKRVWIVIVTGLLLALVFPAAAQDGNVPRFEPGECEFDVPSGQDPDCGYLIVPENRDNPDGATIQLAVAVFHTSNPNPPTDAVIYLEGGPGGSTLEGLNFSFDSLIAPYLDDRDVIAFDQRGVGLSQPALDCPELTDLTYEMLDKHITVDKNIELSVEAITACGDRLQAEGINLDAYNTPASAADVNDLRQVLGYKQLDLLGISYGTRLALTIMRDYPDAVRSAIIDSVVPLQGDKYRDVLSANRAFNALFDACAADAACNEAYPNLKTVFYEVIDQLNANPGTLTVPDLQTGGQAIDAVIDGTGFVSLIFQAMYVQDLLAGLPEAIYAARDGDLSALAPVLLVQLFTLDQISEGMFYAVNCNDEFSFGTPDSIQAILDQAPPELVGFARIALTDPAQLTVCQNLGTGEPDPKENQAVVSDIPTLVLAGEFDPITPPSNAQEAAATLSNSFYYEFPGLTHGVAPSNACTQGITADFFNQPIVAPDTSCIASLPEIAFITPDGVTAQALTTAVNLVPFTDESFGFSGLKPEGWRDIQIGTVARAANLSDQAALTQMALPQVNAEQFVALFATQLGLDGVPEIADTREANGLTWNLYEMELLGFPSDLALAEADGKTYMIQMTSNAGERDALYEAVFLPVIDGFLPMV